ncbi:MAG: tail fiber domain-containing protein [Bacteroidetes bacterium]|nr:tail fiber domain-containing protein [Bacteroidota bacterium]
MKKTYFFFAIFVLFRFSLIAQNIGINLTGASPDASSGLDVSFTDKGVLVPRIALTQTSSASPVTSPATSLLIYNIASVNDVNPGYYYWDGSKWVRILNSSGNFCSSAATNYVTKFTGASSICNSIIYDNGTYVGIGTNIPGATLDVNGNLMVFSGATDGARMVWRGGTGGTQEYRARVLTDGHLGFFPIETGNPGYVGEVLSLFQDGRIQVCNAAYPLGMKVFGNIEVNNSYDDPSPRANHIYFTDPTDANLKGYIGINRNSAAGINKEYLSIEGVEEGVHWMNIVLGGDDGKVGIGTADPQVKLQINTATNAEFLRMDRGAGNPFRIMFGDNLGGSSNATGVVYFEIGGDETYVFGGHVVADASSGRDLGDGSHLWRNVYADDYYLSCYGWLSPYFCSDVRYKKDISPVKNALPDVLKLQGVRYNWRTDEFPDKHFDNQRQIGFIAQDVEKIYPELVKTDNNGFKSIDYGKLTPLLLEAIKEQEKQIEETGKEVKELRTQFEKLLIQLKRNENPQSVLLQKTE